MISMTALDQPAAAKIPAAGPGGVKRGTTPLVRLAKRLRPALNALLVQFSRVGNLPVTDTRYFPWLAEIEAKVPAIRRELDQIMLAERAIPPFRDFAPGHERIVDGNDWRSFFFHGYGYPVKPNLARCPQTAAAIAEVPGLVSAIYSLVAPGAHIRRHRGVSKAIMTAHVALKVPAERDRCRMDVDGVPVVWREGESVVIDDTYPHEVWNDTGETRAVLLIQFRRPMRQPGAWLAGLVIGAVKHSSFVQKARRNLDYWEHAFRLAERNESLA